MTAAGVFQPLYIFCQNLPCTDGAQPYAPMVQASDGNLYGTTYLGGTYSHCSDGCGTVFKITPNGVLTTIYSFCSQTGCPDGQFPFGGIVLGPDGNFYGTTAGGGNASCWIGCGTVFRITPGGTLTTLHTFSGNDGSNPYAGLMLAADGNLYGVSSAGGTRQQNGYGGTVFKVTPNGVLTTLYNFCSLSYCFDGSNPVGTLVQGADGDFYGTTEFGGDLPCPVYEVGCGTTFKVSPGGALTTLHAFNGNDGADLLSGLALGDDGNFYGTAAQGGTLCNYPGCGNVFRMTPAGALTVLHNFNQSDGSYPAGGVMQAPDGLFYGTTGGGGSNGYGTVFSLDIGLPPFVTLQPTSGTVGTPVTILGSNLTGAASVTFNNTPATFQVVSASEITTSVPAGATSGFVQVAVGSSTVHSNTDFQVVGPLQFVPVMPCRLVDTRNNGGPIQAGTSRNFTIPALGGCGIPNEAGAYSLNVTAVPHGRLGYLTIWPQGEIRPEVSTMNSTDGRVKANGAIVPAANNAVSVYATDTTDVILDINGYLASPSAATYKFYPLTPCRIVDTRNGQDGGTLQAGVARDYTIAGNCGIPPEATAYSFNVTAIPTQGSLDYLTVWPQGETMPVVSTLNDGTGTVVANAAIVPAGSHGKTAFYAHNHDTDLLLDVNGYFAAVGQNGLSMYPAPPCRVLDTRANNGQPFTGELTVDVVSSVCAPAAEAKAYIFNATVVPPGPLGFLTLWPDGEQRPNVSTLNAYDGFVTSNMAIVPTSNGSVDAYAAALTQLILDITGYFAP
jgi:uncharacterized repeat protein (TIGR03803 family)